MPQPSAVSEEPPLRRSTYVQPDRIDYLRYLERTSEGSAVRGIVYGLLFTVSLAAFVTAIVVGVDLVSRAISH